jgi:hypothetical protein
MRLPIGVWGPLSPQIPAASSAIGVKPLPIAGESTEVVPL